MSLSSNPIVVLTFLVSIFGSQECYSQLILGRASFLKFLFSYNYNSHRLTLDLWFVKDNRFLNPKSSYGRILTAPPCRLISLLIVCLSFGFLIPKRIQDLPKSMKLFKRQKKRIQLVHLCLVFVFWVLSFGIQFIWKLHQIHFVFFVIVLGY